jgi:hypothetical protein
MAENTSVGMAELPQPHPDKSMHAPLDCAAVGFINTRSVLWWQHNEELRDFRPLNEAAARASATRDLNSYLYWQFSLAFLFLGAAVRYRQCADGEDYAGGVFFVLRVRAFCLLAAEARTQKGECGALVVNGHISNPRYRLRPLPAAPLVVRRRYLIVVTRLLPAAPLVVRRRYLIVAPRPLPRCAPQVLD